MQNCLACERRAGPVRGCAVQAHQLCLLDVRMSSLKTWVLFPSQARGSGKGRQGASRLLLAGDGPWLYYSQPELFGFADALLMHLLREVLSERVLTIERETAFGSEGPFCSQVRGVHVVTCGPRQLLERVLIR